MTDAADGSAILTDADADVGSPALAAALAAVDPDAIGRALRDGYLVVPKVLGETGDRQTRVVGTGDAEHPFELHVFSSAASYARYLGDSRDRMFALERGRGLAPFLQEYGDALKRVAFDPAGPRSVAAPVDAVLASLATALEQEPAAPAEPAEDDLRTWRTTGFELALTEGWFAIDLADAERRDARIAELLERQLRGLPVQPALRRDLADWLHRAVDRASSGGAQLLAFLLRRNDEAALALTAARYWNDLGPAADGTSHLDALAGLLRGRRRDADRLERGETSAGPFLRNVRVADGPAELGADRIPVLVIDYWLPFPDGRGLCLVSFSSPHTDLTDDLLRLCDNIVLHGAWQQETDVTSE